MSQARGVFPGLYDNVKKAKPRPFREPTLRQMRVTYRQIQARLQKRQGRAR